MSYDIYDRVNNTGNGGYSGKSTGDKRANWAIGLAIAGLFCCGGIFSIAAIILGALALGDAYCRNRGRAIAAIIIGIFEVIFWVVLSASIAVSIGNTDTELSDNLVHDDPTAIIEVEETEKPVETGAVEDDEVETGEAEEAETEQERAEKVNSILATKSEEMNIDEIISRYDEGNASYDILNDKHLTVTGYVKSSSIDDEIVIYIDSANLDSWIGSKVVFKDNTNKEDIASIDVGTRITVDGIGDTTGLTFGMYECTLKNVDNSGEYKDGIKVYKEDYKEINIDEIRRNPSENEGKLVQFEGVIKQVMPVSFTSWHERYIVNVGEDQLCFYFDSDQKFIEGDRVRVYGVVNGTMTAENILGVSKTLPDIEATFVEY